MVRWMRRLRKWVTSRHIPVRRPETAGQKDASSALERAQRARVEAERHSAAVSQVAGSLATLRNRNHFAEMIERAFEGGR
ncbi:DUF7620 family protein [Streptomyces zhihengii]